MKLKDNNRISRNGKRRTTLKGFNPFKDKEKLKAIASFAVAVMLLVSSVALSASNMEVYAQESESNQTELEIDIVEGEDADESSQAETDDQSEDSGDVIQAEPTSATEDNVEDIPLEEDADEPDDSDDVIQAEPTSATEDNVEDIPLEEERAEVVDNTTVNTIIPSSKERAEVVDNATANTIIPSSKERAEVVDNATANTIIPSSNNTVLLQSNKTMPINATDTNMTLSEIQSNKGKFIVNVKVTNNAQVDNSGTIDVRIDNGPSQQRTVTFPAKKTTDVSFSFNAKDVPVGRGFEVDLYPKNGKSVGAEGVNSPNSKPEVVNLIIGSNPSDQSKFTVNVKVTNNSPNKDQGRIHVNIDGSAESKTLSAEFPAKKTITKTFQFRGSDVPVGQGFTVVVEPGNSNSVTGHGVNTPSNKPEEVKLAIGQSSAGADKFRVIVQVTNTAAVDDTGGIYVDIDEGPSLVQNGVTFPAKKTIQRTFDFNAKDVPVGRGFTAEVVYGDDYDISKDGVNSPKKGPEKVEIRIPYRINR